MPQQALVHPRQLADDRPVRRAAATTARLSIRAGADHSQPGLRSPALQRSRFCCHHPQASENWKIVLTECSPLDSSRSPSSKVTFRRQVVDGSRNARRLDSCSAIHTQPALRSFRPTFWSALSGTAVFSPSAPRPTYLPRPCARSAAGATYLPRPPARSALTYQPTYHLRYPTCHVTPYHRDYSRSAKIPTLSEVSIGFSIKF